MADTLRQSMAQVQADLPHVRKAERADTGKYAYTYASLADVSEAVLPLLGRNGLAFVCMPTLNDAGHLVLDYRLMHESGEELEGQWPLPSAAQPQQVGSAITYARRYVLCALVGVAPDDDDDGQAATTTAPPADHDQLMAQVSGLLEQLEQAGVEHDPAKIADYATKGPAQAAKTVQRLQGMLP